jgi:integrase
MLTNPERITYEQTKQAIIQLPKEEQILPALAYATGARVSELILIKKKDFYQAPNSQYLEIVCRVLKKRKKGITTRKAIVRMDETWLVTPILTKVNSLEKNEAVLFPLSRVTVYRRLIKIKINGEPINPHGWRKLRATHLHKVFHFDAYQLRSFFEWRDISPSTSYVGIDKKEIEY